MMKTNLRDVKEYKDMIFLTLFYKEGICAYNKTKMIKDISRITSDEFLSLPIWKNNLLQFKTNPIYFTNWVKPGVLYTKDLYDDNGVFRDLRYFEDLILHKNNIICEYYILKTMFNRYTHLFECGKAPYVNIKDNRHILFKGNRFVNKLNIKSSFFYNILVENKFIKPITENVWTEKFDIPKSLWKRIYLFKVAKISDKQISEFNYKLLHKLLNNNLNVSKWNPNVQKYCENCGEIENIEHLIYTCRTSKKIWENINDIFNLDITWKHIVIGFYDETNPSEALNIFISFVTLKIYKYKMKCRITEISCNSDNMYITLKRALYTYLYIAEKSYSNICIKRIFKKACTAFNMP